VSLQNRQHERCQCALPPLTVNIQAMDNWGSSNNSKNDEEEIDLGARIKDISERISLKQSSDKASRQRYVSSAIGAETPVGILSEIRESQERILSVMKDMMLMGEETQKKEEQRHKELCTLLLALGGGMSSTPKISSSFSVNTPVSQTVASKAEYYYGAVALTSGVHVISCVMFHLDMILTQHPYFRKIQNSDKTFMDVKDWHNLCSGVVNADKSSKAGLRIPKPNDMDFRSALNIMASQVQGRRPKSDISHISALMSQTPELMTTVEWVRGALLRCVGCLSPERQCRFRSIQHPFINDSLELSISTKAKLTIPLRSRHQSFLDLKSNQRKLYMNLVLDQSFTPDDALQRAKGTA
jgi:hypothetical protein